MSPILRIARTEILEQRRQPWMLFILAVNYLIWMAVFGIFFLALEGISGNPMLKEMMTERLVKEGVELHTVVKMATSFLASLLFTNLPLYVAITAGTSVLHDRECGTLPFLMSAPITRRTLLIGKLTGAIALPLVLHLLFVGLSSAMFSGMEVVAPYSFKLGNDPAWWVAYLLGAPASALFVGALGTVISALSRDTRTSMQYTSFFIGLLSLGISYILVEGLSDGPGVQATYALIFTVAASLTLLFGAWLIRKDVSAE